MSKRFTDTEKYKKVFVRGLQGAYKLLWDYIYHDCNHAGIWYADFEVAQIYLGKDMPVNKEDALKFFNNGKERIIVLPNDKWFMKSFVEFQYGKLNAENKVHKSVLNELSRSGVTKVLASSLEGAKDKDKEKDKDKDGWFDEVYLNYPNKDSRKQAKKYFLTSVKNKNDLTNIKKALVNYKQHLANRKWKQPKSAQTFFNNWQDWINYEETEEKSDVSTSSPSVRAQIEADSKRK